MNFDVKKKRYTIEVLTSVNLKFLVLLWYGHEELKVRIPLLGNLSH